MSYSTKLKSPKWQKKRLEIMARDGFMCVICNNPNSELHVHHTIYDYSIKEPENYPDETLITLCDDCYNNNHNSKIASHAIITLILLCKLTDRPHSIALTLKNEIEYYKKVCDLTEKEAIKKAFLELIKPV
jgi:hypothetical protein